MQVKDNEFSDPASLKVVDSPDEIWLVYGDLNRDETHSQCCASGGVTWCEDAQFPTDVRYRRADVTETRILALELQTRQADDRGDEAMRRDAERFRWLKVHPTWLGWDADFRPDEIEREIDAAMTTDARPAPNP